ncbi:conserved hypothetical protein [Theileria orientalis strain Shintoku]|uniref:Clathrin light chain n=1 Tax=Theileria orientalis strain Shintoku TaxID=869250 RepID=J4C3S9_THEOR|nr:conserved hypothetical protein [Theileria orientalis strain Shintoku]PVC52206.1 hypothetical protein MACL_00000945 [Theileria orientalis]BAM40971.1 conserved hypothetical protein [Theileria orientalis strain Shintoku]|eukprot:XP_009691272.1 conserved hypothetical protein [Theileria orientalis strain Shintoku]
MDLNNNLLDIKSPESEKAPEDSTAQAPLSHQSSTVTLDLSRSNSHVSNEVKVNNEFLHNSIKPESALNPYELWVKNNNERLEKLKVKEAQDVENRIKTAAQELENWHNDRKKQIEEKLKKLLEEEESNKPSEKNVFDWVKTCKYLQTSEFFIKDQSGGQNQKLIELILKKRKLLEKENAQKEQPVNNLI